MMSLYELTIVIRYESNLLFSLWVDSSGLGCTEGSKSLTLAQKRRKNASQMAKLALATPPEW